MSDGNNDWGTDQNSAGQAPVQPWGAPADEAIDQENRWDRAPEGTPEVPPTEVVPVAEEKSSGFYNSFPVPANESGAATIKEKTDQEQVETVQPVASEVGGIEMSADQVIAGIKEKVTRSEEAEAEKTQAIETLNREIEHLAEDREKYLNAILGIEEAIKNAQATLASDETLFRAG